MLTISSPAHATVYISEFVASNATGLEDETGDRPDWIELHNGGTQGVNLLGWKITDGSSEKNIWAFPECFLEPGAYLVIFASGENRTGTQPFHTNFELKRSGETLTLIPPDESYTPGAAYPKQTTDIAYGIINQEFRYLHTPTPGKPNDPENTYSTLLPEPEISHAPGWFDTPFNLAINTADQNIKAFYTLDGSIPTHETGTPYKNAIPITATAILRILLHRPDSLSPPISTHTFLHAPTVASQIAPENYPEFWAEDIRADYEMTTHPQLIPALKALPVISLVTDPRNLFDKDSGIYMNPEQDGSDWERAVSFEIPGSIPIQINATIRIQGRSSRQPRTSPKHSFRILFKHPYGPTTLNHPIFHNDTKGPEYNTLVLRATSNHSWTYPLADQRERAQYLRDPWTKETQRAMGHIVPRTKFTHLFLNGLYWGIYTITERPDDAFMAQHFGKKKSKYDVIKGGEVVAGSDRSWRKLFALANQGLESTDRYHAFTQLVDLDSFIDFIILNHFIGNETWDFGNWYAARHNSEGSRFQFFCWDAETSMNRIHENRVLTRNANRPTALFQALRKNEKFRRLFARRFIHHTTGDGALTPQRTIARYKALATELDLPIIAESARWGDYRMTTHSYRTPPFEFYTRKHWLGEQTRLLKTYFPVRTNILHEQYRSIGLVD